jgi:hydroxymethylpyrimidine pyrophosphatase-like HAD family hydrolase
MSTLTRAARATVPAGAPLRYRLVALDIDGTLVTPQGHVAPRTARAVAQALARGALVVLCTGRHFSRGIRHLAAELGLSLPAIVRNGAAVQDLATGAVLAQRVLPPEALRRALDAMLGCAAGGGTVPVVEEGPRYGERLFTLPQAQWNAAVPYFILDWQRSEHLRFVAAPEELYGVRDASWLGGCGTREAAQHVYDTLRDLAGASVLTTVSRAPEWDLHCTSVVPAGCSKASALAAFAAERGIALAEVLAVGDWYNDVEMLAEAGWGVAMGQAPDEVKAAADAVVPDNTHDGAAIAIERYLLGLD